MFYFTDLASKVVCPFTLCQCDYVSPLDDDGDDGHDNYDDEDFYNNNFPYSLGDNSQSTKN